ncbi:MAG: BTAD domain-containing putative transcriptional regulator [Solirubrobacteraceae bacterium]
MQIRFLGHLEVSVDDRPVTLGGAKQRAVLAMLGLEANRPVSADHLIEGLWGEHSPASAAKMVQNYVWRLRGALDDAGAEILTRGRGYELRIDPGCIDVRRFEKLLAEASRAAGAGEQVDAAREALALWRGSALADLVGEPFAAREIRRLEELRVVAAELAIDADLAAGRHQEVAAEIDALVGEHSLRERLHAQRMLALYRCGRQAEALEAYRHARRTLVEEVGLEPGPELRRLHKAILRQDPSLDVESAVAQLPRELDATAAPPLVGRDGELRRVRARWQRAATGSGAFVTLVGAYGMGKTRMAAAIAGDAHREGAAVLYAGGAGPSEAALVAIARTRDARRPTLLVLDDVDRAPAEVRVALRELATALGHLPALVLATGQEAAALARLEPRESITLEPLGAEAIGLIAGFYAPAGGGDAVPVETLLATSGGVARRVHEAASGWARREATRRVDAVAGRAAAGRSEARALEAELAGNVVDLQSVRERAGLLAGDGADAQAAVVCPYKGLETFDTDDAEYFFGREQLVAELVARLVGAPLLAVVGPSGSGKSSVVRAGLLPALAGGVLPGSERWARALIRPGEHPMRELRRAADQLGRERRSVLIVDQFEELFTACQDERERSEFVAALVGVARDPGGDSPVVLAVRADFYGRCAAYPELSRLLGTNHVLVGAMSRDELRRAIERPAQRVGLRVELELVDALLTDVEGQPGALPLLSTALLELWRRRDGRRLRLAAYVRSGGVQGAVARLAEDAFVGLDPSQQAVARKVLLRLAGEGEGAVIVRRRVGLAELEGPEVAKVVARLTDQRLLTVSDGAVEVAHEALLREWPRLRAWLEDDVQGRRLHGQISDAARAWDADARDPSGLYRGTRLSGALEWRSGHEDELNATERAFLDASHTAHERANRRLRTVLAGVSLLLVVAVIAGGVALDQRANARSKERTAAAQVLDVQALTDPALDRSLLLARQAVSLADSPATRGNLLGALLRSPAAIGVLRGDGDPLLSLALSPDGRTLAVAENDGTVRFLDAATRRPVGRPYDIGKRRIPELGYSPDSELEYSPDGTRLAVADASFPVGGFIDLLDARTHRRIDRLYVEGLGPAAPSLKDVMFSPDSRVLIAHRTSETVNGSGPGELMRWDARTGRLRKRQPAAKDLALIDFLAGGKRLLTTSASTRTATVRDALTLRPLRRFHVDSRAGASTVSPDGRLAALGAADGSVRFLDLRSGKVRTASGRHDAPVRDARFTPEGRTLVTAGDDANVIVWNVADASARETLEGHAGLVREVAVSPDSRTAYTASVDGSVVAWDLAGTRRLGRPFHAAPVDPGGPVAAAGGDVSEQVTPDDGNLPPSVIAATPDGATFAIPRSDGNVDLYDSSTLARTAVIPVNPGERLFSVAIAPDGRTLAGTTLFGAVSLWDLRTRRPRGPSQTAHVGPVWTPTFSRDGLWMATSDKDGRVRLWDVRRRRLVASLQERGAFVDDVGLSPDGNTLAVTTGGEPGKGSVEIYSVPRLARTAVLHAPWGRWGRFSPDGRVLVFADHDGRLRLFDTKTWKPRTRPVNAHRGEVLSINFSPDSRTLATTSLDGNTRLWDIASGRPIGAGLAGPPQHRSAAIFVRRGTHLLVVSDDGRALLWDLRPSSWARQACSVAGRTLTRDEWENALPGRDYAPACRKR